MTPPPATGGEAGYYGGGDVTVGRLGVVDGPLSMGFGGAEAAVTDVAKWLLAVFLPALDAQGATNYLEWQLRLTVNAASGSRSRSAARVGARRTSCASPPRCSGCAPS